MTDESGICESVTEQHVRKGDTVFYCYGVLLETKELLRRASLFLSWRMSEVSKILNETIR